jgi:three-Cys-motif partner protein
MLEHSFGGTWTEAKLAALRDYLTAYRSVFAKNDYFTTWYVDAFAGTGSRSIEKSKYGLFDIDDSQSESDEESQSDSDAFAYLDGSAKIALGLTSPFHRYLFIEKSKARVDELKSTIDSNFPILASRCDFEQSDANAALSAWCAKRDWKKERAIVFLDPYGMQVNWDTVSTLGRTKAVDLWYLFPLGVVRMLTKDGKIEQSWQDRLDKLFGTSDWRERFYKTKTETNLFGEQDVTNRNATVKTVQSYIEERLKTAFTAVAPSLVLKNSKASPMFALCFAAGNERGAPIALRIAKSILKEN